jgi:hypothetical protein
LTSPLQDAETIAITFLAPLIAPTPVATRLPDVTDPADQTNGFVRIESGWGSYDNLVEYSTTFLCHTYVPFEYEIQGAQIASTVVAYMSAAQGVIVNVPGKDWFIADVPNATSPTRLSDPKVNLLRYMSRVTWTIYAPFPPRQIQPLQLGGAQNDEFVLYRGTDPVVPFFTIPMRPTH